MPPPRGVVFSYDVWKAYGARGVVSNFYPPDELAVWCGERRLRSARPAGMILASLGSFRFSVHVLQFRHRVVRNSFSTQC